MSNLAETDTLFFDRAGLDRGRVEKTVAGALKGAEDGELFLEYSQSEALSFDDGRAEKRQLRHHPGLRPAGGRRRDAMAMPMPASSPKPRSSALPRR